MGNFRSVRASGAGGSTLLFCLAAALTFTGGMATASLYTNMMDRCSPRTGATDFSLQQSLAATGPLLAAAFSGFSAARLGYAGHFAACAGLSLAVIGVAARFWAEPIEATRAGEHSPG